MERAWTVAPTDERIVQDCMAIPGRVDKIVAAKGVAVPDIAFRTGRRALSAKGDRELKAPPRKRQRKASHSAPPLHPDAQQSWDDRAAEPVE